MRILIWCFVLILVFVSLVAADAQAGAIPDAFMMDEKKPAETISCESFSKRQSELLKKISDLKRRENRYLSELEKMARAYCDSAQGGEK